MPELDPLTFRPLFKERVWGGRALREVYGKAIPSGVPIGESWEIADLPGSVSLVAGGPFAGRDLRWLMENRRSDLLGDCPAKAGRFPLLVKVLDARTRLSLQVHPPGAVAKALGGEPKTELWYITRAEAQADLFVGLRPGVTREVFSEQLKRGEVADCFHRIPVKPGDVMFLPSGRVHAIGGGNVLFEIQENSDTTYRVFDWNRTGLDGKPRALHLRESLRSIDFQDVEPPLVVKRFRAMAPPGGERCVLVEASCFSVEEFRLAQGVTIERMSRGRPEVLGVVQGVLLMEWQGQRLRLGPGGFCLLPANRPAVALRAVSSVTFLRALPGRAVRSARSI